MISINFKIKLHYLIITQIFNQIINLFKKKKNRMYCENKIFGL